MDTALPSSPRDASAQAPAEAPVAPTVNPSSFRPAQPKPSRTNTEAYLDFSSPHPKSFQNSFPTTIAAMKVDRRLSLQTMPLRNQRQKRRRDLSPSDVLSDKFAERLSSLKTQPAWF